MHSEMKKNLLKALDPTDKLLSYFEYAHLTDTLAAVSRPFGEVAARLVGVLPACAERTVGLRKLLEAKDCAVRASLWDVYLDVERDAARRVAMGEDFDMLRIYLAPGRPMSDELNHLAQHLLTLPVGPQRRLAIERLIEAKDAFVRASMEAPPAASVPEGGQ